MLTYRQNEVSINAAAKAIENPKPTLNEKMIALEKLSNLVLDPGMLTDAKQINDVFSKLVKLFKQNKYAFQVMCKALNLALGGEPLTGVPVDLLPRNVANKFLYSTEFNLNDKLNALPDFLKNNPALQNAHPLIKIREFLKNNDANNFSKNYALICDNFKRLLVGAKPRRPFWEAGADIKAIESQYDNATTNQETHDAKQAQVASTRALPSANYAALISVANPTKPKTDEEQSKEFAIAEKLYLESKNPVSLHRALWMLNELSITGYVPAQKKLATLRSQNVTHDKRRVGPCDLAESAMQRALLLKAEGRQLDAVQFLLAFITNPKKQIIDSDRVRDMMLLFRDLLLDLHWNEDATSKQILELKIACVVLNAIVGGTQFEGKDSANEAHFQYATGNVLADNDEGEYICNIRFIDSLAKESKLAEAKEKFNEKLFDSVRAKHLDADILRPYLILHDFCKIAQFSKIIMHGLKRILVKDFCFTANRIHGIIHDLNEANKAVAKAAVTQSPANLFSATGISAASAPPLEGIVKNSNN